MSTTNTKMDVLLLFRSSDWYNHVSAEELQAAMTKFQGWFQSLEKKGVVKGAGPLQHTGKIISGKGGRQVSDGPFAESKEAVGGYLMVSVGSFEEAVALAKTAPMLEYDTTIEARPLAEECPIMDRAREIMSEEQLAAFKSEAFKPASADLASVGV